ncbi:MAG: RagB/SusD family nutrient uptake outer membrane protein [Tannerella sp.]|jgi:hypothetical protein|nr:RagB/SusD family nutrient uptake outer membrane protein [Tannerella sp.]
MKKILCVAATALLFAACTDFLTVSPENDMTEDAFFKTEKDLELYANGLLNKYLPGADEIAFADQHADNVATRSSTTFLIGDSWRPEDQGGWGDGASGKWAQLRDANWLLDRLPRVKGLVPDDVYSHYTGVGRFWRAYFYYSMVRTFGDVPWYDHELDRNETDELYKGRDSRELVMDNVLDDLNFASTYCSTDARMVTSSTRITRWVALAFKARVCLFEGTYRKYHPELNLTASSEKFLREAVDACETLMSESPYQLETGGSVDTRYRSLFNGDDLNEKEVILGAVFRAGVRMHEITWKMFSATYGANWSLTRQFVNQYLMRDGSRFTDRAGYETMSFADEFANRDCRLQQTVISPGYRRRVNGADAGVAPNFTMNFTGYQLVKWAIDDEVHVGKATSANSLPVFRYAEVLLNYAEAKAELGEMGDAEWDKSVKLLRERAGVASVVPATHDPYLAQYYNSQTTDRWILEVRRERGVELAFEQLRYDDIMRWKMGDLIEKPWQGVYIAALDQGYDFNGDGTVDLTVSRSGNASATRVKIDDSTFRLSNGDSGYLTYGQHLNRMWLDKKYLRPVPASAVLVNPNLLPNNPGW